jgi:hypothetical protein
MRLSCVIVVGLAGFVFVPAAKAVNPSWTAGYPQPGTAVSTILVKGQISVADTETTTGAARITAWLVGGGPMNVTNITVPVGSGLVTWGEKATNNTLTSGSTYNVVVSIEVKNKATGVSYFMNTDPATSKAK